MNVPRASSLASTMASHGTERTGSDRSEDRDVSSANLAEKAKPAPPAGPPSFPDGGLEAWMQTAGAFVLFLNSWGVVNTYGK